MHTITTDNRKEFANHEQIAGKLKAEFYFAHLNAAWQRDSNENTIGLVKQYFPKKQSFDNIPNEDTELVLKILNNRPRKCLNFKSPIEELIEQSIALNT